MSQTSAKCCSMKDKGEQVVSFFKEWHFFFQGQEGGKNRKKKKVLQHCYIYNLPPLQKHKIIKETSLKNSLWWIKRILDFS